MTREQAFVLATVYSNLRDATDANLTKDQLQFEVEQAAKRLANFFPALRPALAMRTTEQDEFEAMFTQ